MRRAVTLTEMLVVVIIIGIIATLAITQFSGPKEQVIEKEAKATLRLIAAAQKIYRMEVGSFVHANNTTEVNERLRMHIVNNTSSALWNYSIENTADTFRANATRGSKVLYINETLENAQ